MSVEVRPPYAQRGQNVRMCESKQVQKFLTRTANPDYSRELLAALKRATFPKRGIHVVELP